MAHAVLTLHCRFADLEPLTADLWERGTLGLQETELTGGQYEIRAYFDAPFTAAFMPGFVSWHQESDITGNEWQDAWQPVAIGQKLWLAPNWLATPPPVGRLRVNVHPGQGSGTSYSEPTLLMLEVLEQIVSASDTVADIGTGSGILTAAAHALGARRLFACDIDHTAAAEAAQTLLEDGIHANIWCGSPRSLASRSATLVLANLNAIQLEALATELTRILAPGGRLLLGGFTERNLPRMEAVFAGPHVIHRRGPWRALLYKPSV